MKERQTNVKTKSLLETFQSKSYKVVMLNDNRTTFDFVIEMLMTVFNKTFKKAREITLDVDKKGSAVAGTGYTKDIAETKKKIVEESARAKGYPFKLRIEEEDI